MVKHPWHEVAVGDGPPEKINAIIEIPKGSRAKYEIHKDSGLIMLDRVLYASMYYPQNYGFIPQTLGEDGDPLDIMVLTQITVVPRCLIPSKVIGVMRMIDKGEPDDKILAVAEGDASVAHINDVNELPDYFKVELKHFFEEYKTLENKKVIVDDFQSKEKGMSIIVESIERYQTKFKK